MQNRIKTLEFKRKYLEFHYSQAANAANALTPDCFHVCVSEFAAMMEVMYTCIEIARSCVFDNNAVDFKAYLKSMDDEVKAELLYIQQWVEANRVDHLIHLRETPELHAVIKPLPKRHETGYYQQRELVPYMMKVKGLAEQVISDLMDLYRQDHISFDQSWRTVDVYRSSLACKACGTQVTRTLRHLGDLREISLKEKESYVPRFSYVYGHEIIRADLLPYQGANEITDAELIVHIESLDTTTIRKTAGGCCGPDASVFNIFCKNGHPIGKEGSDCWMPHFIRIPLQGIKKHDLIRSKVRQIQSPSRAQSQRISP
ncbi:hypothetical protein [Paenibacillus sp.]|uniref:hypothetical protein n=1 Tax=Paenibacillus sp. TaxID=58172 RepID=UPI00356616EC